MGKANRARRAAKKRSEQRRAPHGSWEPRSEGRAAGPSDADMRFLMVRAARALAASDATNPADDALQGLHAAAAHLGAAGRALVVDQIFCACLDSIWEGGWQPSEVLRAVGRRLGGLHGDLLCTAVAAQHATHETDPPSVWLGQIEELGAMTPWWGSGTDWLGPWTLRSGLTWMDALETAVETLSVLLDLPKTHRIAPPPSDWSTWNKNDASSHLRVDVGVLEKVRALLAKAESTNFQHEADALTAKAQELMARHAIDEAIAGADRDCVREVPGARRLPVDDPYANAKSSLLGVVADANQVRAIWDQDYALMTLIGFETDLEAVEILYTSLFMQASRSVLANGQVRDSRGRSRTRSFRQSFYVAFAERIHERLTVAANCAREGAERELGRNLLPVLAHRRQEVDDLTDQMFPHLTVRRGSAVTNAEGWRAGRVAAEMATLGPLRRRLEGKAG